MTLIGSLAIYFVIWWIVLFAVLPFGVESQEPGEVTLGTDSGAPRETFMLRKLVVTSLIAGVIFAVVYVFFDVLGYTIDDILF
jgi:predicted secreted protein